MVHACLAWCMRCFRVSLQIWENVEARVGRRLLTTMKLNARKAIELEFSLVTVHLA
jgi:hypothetical protein